MSTRRTGLMLALLSAVISGVSVYVNGLGVRHFSNASVYTTAKNAVAGLLLLGLFAATAARRRGARERAGARGRPGAPDRRLRPALALPALALLGGSVPFVLFFEGLARAQSTQAAFLQKTLIVWVALLAVPLLRERLRRPHGIAVVLLVAGQAWLAGRAGHVVFGAGEAMILAATLLWAVEVIFVKRLLAAGYDEGLLATTRMALGASLLVLWVILTGHVHLLASMSAAQWRWVLVTGVLLAGYVGTWYAALARAPAVDVTAVLVFGAVITAVLAGLEGTAAVNVPALIVVTAGCAIAAGAARWERDVRSTSPA